MRLSGLVNFKPLKEGGEVTKKEASYPDTQVRNDLGTDSLHEAESVDYKSLPPAEKKQIDVLLKLFSGRQFQVFDGIHGKILYIKTSEQGRRITANELKALVASKVRWIDTGKEYITIGV
jgi:hypothetical protein